MNSTHVSISLNSSWLEGEALQRWAGILKRALARCRGLEIVLGEAEPVELTTARLRQQEAVLVTQSAFAQGE